MKKLLNFLAALFIIFAVIDSLLTFWAINTGRYIELNPLIVNIAGSWVYPAGKVAVGIIFAAALLIIGRKFLKLAVATFAITSVFGFILLRLNILALLGYR